MSIVRLNTNKLHLHSLKYGHPITPAKMDEYNKIFSNESMDTITLYMVRTKDIDFAVYIRLYQTDKFDKFISRLADYRHYNIMEQISFIDEDLVWEHHVRVLTKEYKIVNDTIQRIIQRYNDNNEEHRGQSIRYIIARYFSDEASSNNFNLLYDHRTKILYDVYMHITSK